MPLQATQFLTTGIHVLRGKEVPAYTLEYLTPCQYHASGTHDTLVLPKIELGRDASCTVRFGEDMPTVSRKHASISREGDEMVLRNLSQTNPTFVNDKEVNSIFYLQSGDLIQLSADGPKMRFILPKNGVKSLAFTQRLQLFTQQSMGPYRKTIRALAAVVLLLGVGAVYALYAQYNVNQNLNQQASLQSLQLRSQDSTLNQQEVLMEALDSAAYSQNQHRKQDSIQYFREMRKTAKQVMLARKELSNIQADNHRLRQIISSQETKIQDLEVEMANSEPSFLGTPQGAAAIYDEFKDQIYFLSVLSFTVEMPDGTQGELDISWNGTGFLLADGRFVTARHCIQGWRYLSEGATEENILANMAEQIGGKVLVTFAATAPNGRSFQFTSEQMTLDDSKDETESIEGPGGKMVQIKVAKPNATDWAYLSKKQWSNLDLNTELATQLRAATPVIILGYSYGNSLQSKQNIEPLFSESKVGRNGLNAGLITLTDRNFGQGNSGGPVLAKDEDGTYKVVGIVSAGLGSEIGIVVPISCLK